MTELSLSAAFGDYDRIAPLRSGAVRPDGVRLDIRTLPPGEIFRRMCRDLEFQVSEMSMGAHMFLTGSGDCPFVAMPAFPSRAFRHAMVYAHVDAGIHRAEDLNGKRIAIREWGMTAVVWIVGILVEEHGLELESVEWVAEHEPRVPIPMPEGTRIRYMEPGENLSDLLDSGKVDAALIHEVPACFATGSARVKRVFPDYEQAERDYYRRTGVHPIMHCAVVRRDVQRRHPWVVKSVYEALCTARTRTMEALLDTGVLAAMVPFLPAVMDDTRRTFGEDFWPYGMESNRRELERLVHYGHQQGLTSRLLAVEELFDETVRG
jgi:4,5-dihydroxyphthalate decarboxylase